MRDDLATQTNTGQKSPLRNDIFSWECSATLLLAVVILFIAIFRWNWSESWPLISSRFGSQCRWPNFRISDSKLNVRQQGRCRLFIFSGVKKKIHIFQCRSSAERMQRLLLIGLDGYIELKESICNDISSAPFFCFDLFHCCSLFLFLPASFYSYLYGVAHDYSIGRKWKKNKRKKEPEHANFFRPSHHGNENGAGPTAARHGHYGMQMMNAAGRRTRIFQRGQMDINFYASDGVPVAIKQNRRQGNSYGPLFYTSEYSF